MSKRYCNNNWIRAVDDLQWLINEIKDEQECIKSGMIDEPLSGFNGFWYALVKDFALNEGDEEALITLIATANNLTTSFKADRTKPYVFDSADALINVLENTMKYISEQKSTFKVKSDNN